MSGEIARKSRRGSLKAEYIGGTDLDQYSMASKLMRGGSKMRKEFSDVSRLRPILIVSSLMLTIASFAGCAGQDRRLVADEQSCRNMGHAAGTPEFKQCMHDL